MAIKDFFCPHKDMCTLADTCAHAEAHQPMGFRDGSGVKCNTHHQVICGKDPCIQEKHCGK